MDFQQSRTYSNLINAYNTELMSSAEDIIYGDRVRQEGYIELGNIYDIASRNNKEHARIWLRQINNGVLPSTEQVLLDSISKTNFTANEMYREYAQIAIEEGYNNIASLFNGVANIHLNHGLNFRTYYENIQTNQVFCKPVSVLWICIQCGNIMLGACAPTICPVCGFPQGYYRVYNAEE